MNDSDTDANVKAVDLLLNYDGEIFRCRGAGGQPHDRSIMRYEKASVQAYVSPAVLNAGQATIFTIGPPSSW